MRTRNNNINDNNNSSNSTPKPAVPPTKKTPPKKAAAMAAMVAQTPSNSADPVAESPATPSETKRVPTTRAKQAKAAAESTSKFTAVSDTASAPEVSAEETQASGLQVVSPQEAKPASGGKTTRKVVRKVVRKTLVRVPKQIPKPIGAEKVQAEDVGKVETEKDDETLTRDTEEPIQIESAVENVDGALEQDQDVVHVDESLEKEKDVGVVEDALTENSEIPLEKQEYSIIDLTSVEDQLSRRFEEEKKEEKSNFMDMKGAEELKEVKVDKIEEDNAESLKGKLKVDEDVEELRKDDSYLEEAGEEKFNIYDDDDEYLEQGQDDFAEGDLAENIDEAEASKEERAQLDAVAQERKLRKELEVFVGGLERDATEEDVRKVFQYAGEVVDVKVHRDPTTNKNKGYAFVRFATKEQASRALSEMKNPVIRGKRCGTAPAEDNDTLFLGNICNTWTKEAVKQKLKDYGIEGVERITLVADPRHEGLSRGFAFVEFSSHGEAMSAYKRLQKPDALFGHPERTAKVAFAEPLREPDPEVMAQVKSVFIDGLPPYWDEERVRDKFQSFGEIARIMLARNMSSAKRKDFGFVDFTTHEAALACVEGINNTELGDGNLKTKVRARLSNPLPKTQAVKGGMVGGFRIGRGSSGSFQKAGGRGFSHGGHSYNRATFQRGRGFYPRGSGQSSRMGFGYDHKIDYPPFHGRQNFGRGGRWGFRGPHQMSSGGPPMDRPNLERPRHGSIDRARGDHDAFRRQQFPYEEGYNRPYMGRHYDEPYYYDDTARGGKRPYYMMDQDPEYVEPSRLRARMDYSDPTASFRGSRSRDSYGADSRPYPHDYYGPDYGGGTYQSYDGAGRPYGRGYYY